MNDDDVECVGSCENCGCDIYSDEANLGELCDQCQWWLEQAN